MDNTSRFILNFQYIYDRTPQIMRVAMTDHSKTLLLRTSRFQELPPPTLENGNEHPP